MTEFQKRTPLCFIKLVSPWQRVLTVYPPYSLKGRRASEHVQKPITLLSSFQATMQDYNKSHDNAAAREKRKMANCYLEKGWE